MWSNARTGSRPHFIFGIFKTLRYFLANLLFFVPKRKILIEIIDQTSELKKLSQGDLASFNHYLENFYNQN